MFEKYKERKQKFLQEKSEITKEVKAIVFKHKDFSFSKWKENGYFGKKKSAEDVSDIDSEEFMMRYFGFFKPESRFKRWLKWIIIFALLYYAYFNWGLVREALLNLMGQYPFIASTLTYVNNALGQKLLVGLFLITFFSHMILITLPDEVFFITYLLAGHNPFVIIAVSITGSLLGLALNYFIGVALGGILIKRILKKNYYEYKFSSDKYGGLVLLVGNIIPSPVQWFVVALGSFNYGFMKMLMYSFVGKLIKYSALFYGFQYYTQSIGPEVEKSLACIKDCMNQTNSTLLK